MHPTLQLGGVDVRNAIQHTQNEAGYDRRDYLKGINPIDVPDNVRQRRVVLPTNEGTSYEVSVLDPLPASQPRPLGGSPPPANPGPTAAQPDTDN